MSKSGIESPTVAKGGVQQAVVRLATAATAIVVAPILARHFGPVSYGYITLLTLIATAISTLFDAGFSVAAARDYPQLKNSAKLDEWTQGFWNARLATAGIAGAVSLTVTLAPLPPVVKGGMALVAVYVPLQLVLQAGLGLLVARLDTSAAAVVEAVTRMAMFLGVIPIIALGLRDIRYWLGAMVLSQALGLGVLLRGQTPTPGFSRPVGSFFADLKALGVVATLPLLGFAYSRADQIVLAITRTNAELGLYGLIFRILDGAVSVLAVPTALVLPWLSGAPGAIAAGHRYRASLFAITSLTLAASLLLVPLSRPIFDLAAGSQYISVAGDSGIRAFGIVLALFGLLGIGAVNGSALLSTHRASLVLRHFAAAICVRLALALTLIPRYGVLGGAVGAVAAEAIAVLHSSWLLARHTNFAVEVIPVVAVAVASALSLAVGFGVTVWPVTVVVSALALTYYSTTPGRRTLKRYGGLARVEPHTPSDDSPRSED